MGSTREATAHLLEGIELVAVHVRRVPEQEPGLDWSGIMAVYPMLSTGEQVMVEVAYQVFTGNPRLPVDNHLGGPVTLAHVLALLDGANLARVVQALVAARGIEVAL